MSAADRPSTTDAAVQRSVRRIFERGQVLEGFLGRARRHDLAVHGLELLVGQHDQFVADARNPPTASTTKGAFPFSAMMTSSTLSTVSPASLTTEEPMTLLARKPVATLMTSTFVSWTVYGTPWACTSRGVATTAAAAATATVRKTRRRGTSRSAVHGQRRTVSRRSATRST